MAARLPTEAEIPLVTPQPERMIASYQGGIAANAAARADAEIGQTDLQTGDQLSRGLNQVAQGAEHYIDAQDAVNGAAAEGKFLTQLSQLRSQAESDPDYATVPQRYSQQVQAMGAQASQGITGATARAEFQNRIARYQNFANDTFNQIAKTRSVAADRAYLGTYLGGVVDQYGSAADDVTREGLLGSASQLLQGMAAKGSITPAEMEAYAKTTNETVQTNRAKAFVDTNPVQASKLLAPTGTTESGEPIFAKTGSWVDHVPSSVRAPLYESALEKSNALVARTEADKYTGGPSPAPTAPVPAVTAAILNQESGNGATSANIGQIQPGTWAQYAKPGEDINNSDDNRAVAQRIISDLSAKTNGDPSRIAVGYFSGPGNIAPPGSPTPWLHDYADGNGKTTSSYVQDVTTRMGAMAKAGLKTDEATALARVDQDYANNPQLGRFVKAEVMQRYQAVNMAAAAQQQQQTVADQQAADGYTQRLLSGDVNGVLTDIKSDPKLQWSTRWRLNEMGNTLLKGEDKDTGTYGKLFWPTFNRVASPPGTEGRISDPAEIYALGGNGLTVAGVDKLNTMLKGKNTPDGEANSAIMKGAMAYAKHQLSFEQDFGVYKIPDPKGEDAFNIGFTPAFFRYWENGLKAGKAPNELADQKEIDKVIAPFKRNPAALAQDFANAGIDAQAAQTTAPGSAPQLDTIPPPMAARVPGQTSVTTAKGKFMWQADGWHPVQ